MTNEKTDENIDAKKKTDPPERRDPVELEAQKAIIDALKIKKAEIDETLSQVEKRNKEFKEMVDELKMSGKSAAGNPGPSEEEKAKQAARNLIRGSGFEDRIML